MKGYEAVARTLVDLGVDTVFGLMGDANMQYLTELMAGHGVRYVAAVHEAGATSMADAYARVTGRIGVVSVTHGPGLTNTMTALVEAVRARSHVLVLTGDTPAGAGSLQNFDIAGFTAVTGAGYERVEKSDRCVETISNAMRRISSENRPVVLNIPVDLMLQEAGEATAWTQPVHERSGPDEEALDDALGLIASSRRPIVLAGRGAVRSGARDELVRLAELIGAPLATTLLAKDYFRGEPFDLGVCGTLSTTLGGTTIAAADCIVAFGASLNRHTSGEGALLAGKRVVHVDLDRARIGSYLKADVALIGDARLTASAMVERLAAADVQMETGRRPGLDTELAQQDVCAEFTDRSASGTVDARTAMIRLERMLPRDKVMVTDVGRFMSAPWRFLTVADPMCFMHTINFASIGLALASGIGASLARPDQVTVAVVGDGGFMMSAMELSTAVRNRLPLVVVVVNDACYGAEYRKLEEYGLDPKYSFSEWPDLAEMARGMGAAAHTVSNLDELDALGGVLTSLQGPVLIDLRVDPAVDIQE